MIWYRTVQLTDFSQYVHTQQYSLFREKYSFTPYLHLCPHGSLYTIHNSLFILLVALCKWYSVLWVIDHAATHGVCPLMSLTLLGVRYNSSVVLTSRVSSKFLFLHVWKCPCTCSYMYNVSVHCNICTLILGCDTCILGLIYSSYACTPTLTRTHTHTHTHTRTWGFIFNEPILTTAYREGGGEPPQCLLGQAVQKAEPLRCLTSRELRRLNGSLLSLGILRTPTTIPPPPPHPHPSTKTVARGHRQHTYVKLWSMLNLHNEEKPLYKRTLFEVPKLSFL